MKSLKIFGIVAVAVTMLMVVGCKPNVETPHEHTYKEEWSSDETHHWHDPSCDDTDKVKDKAKHKWDKGEVTAEPTCTEAGVKTYTCTVCGKTKTAEYKKALGHKSDDGEITTEPTCTEKGVKTYKCTVCNEVMETKEIAELGHEWNDGEVTTKETCTADGVKTYTCKTCSDTYTEAIAKHHTWDAGEVTTAPTCGKEGVKTYTCTACKEKKTEAVAKLDHPYSEAWTSDGTNHWHAATCEHTAEVSGTAEHEWNNGSVTTVPTCGAEGVRTYTCNVCGTTKTEVMPATGKHEYGDLIVNDATGIGTKTCSACNSDWSGPVLKTCGYNGEFQTALGVLGVETNNSANVTKVVFGLLSDSEISAKVAALTKKTDIGVEDGTCYAYAEDIDGDMMIIYIVPEDENATGFVFNKNSRGMFMYFNKCEEIAGLDLADTSQVTDMLSMFAFCNRLTELDLSNFDTSKVTIMESMFVECHSLKSLNVGGKFDTSNVKRMRMMFHYCDKLESLNVSNFNTSNVTTMESMFCACKKLVSLDLSTFDTSNVTDMRYMFYGCSGLTALDLSKFDMSNVTDMDQMFYGCSGLESLNVSNFDTSKVTTMSNMFSECSKLETIYVTNADTLKGADGCTKTDWLDGCAKSEDEIFVIK